MNESVLVRDKLIGHTANGDKYFLTVKVRQKEGGLSVTHEKLEGFTEISFTGVLVTKYGSVAHERGWISCGQNDRYLLDIVKPAKGFSLADIRRIYELWNEYHLGGMNSKCAHQDKNVEWDKAEPCPVTGYEAGSAWLVRDLPIGALEEIRELVCEKVSA